MRTEPSAAAENRRAGRNRQAPHLQSALKEPDLLRADLTAALENEIDRGSLEPFYTTKGNEGTGLGLSSVHGFVNQSNGLIEISSRLDEGTTIYLYIPTHDHRERGGQEKNKFDQEEIDRPEETYHITGYA